MDAVTESVGTTNVPASAIRPACTSSMSASRQTCASPSAPRWTASRACSSVLTCTRARRPSACAAAMSARIVSRSSVGMSIPNASPSSWTILIQSEPSALRARTQACAWSGPFTMSTGTPNCVPCPPAAVASIPAEKRSASSPRVSVSRAARLAATSCGSLNWSSTVVTPKRTASFNELPNVCTWPSMSPGTRVRPRPSTRARSCGNASDRPTSRMRLSATQTSCSGRNAAPSNTCTSTIAKLAFGQGICRSVRGAGSGSAMSAPMNRAVPIATLVTLRATVLLRVPSFPFLVDEARAQSYVWRPAGSRRQQLREKPP